MNKPTAQEMLTVLAMTTDERRSLLHFHECFPDDLIKLAAKIEAVYLRDEERKASNIKSIYDNYTKIMNNIESDVKHGLGNNAHQ